MQVLRAVNIGLCAVKFNNTLGSGLGLLLRLQHQILSSSEASCSLSAVATGGGLWWAYTPQTKYREPPNRNVEHYK